MFHGGLFVQAIGVGSNHVAKEVLVTLAKKIMKKTRHCHHATR
jgi:fucose permease